MDMGELGINWEGTSGIFQNDYRVQQEYFELCWYMELCMEIEFEQLFHMYFRILNWILDNHKCIFEIPIQFPKTPIVFQNSQLDIRKS